jgi:hypothetical protein
MQARAQKRIIVVAAIISVGAGVALSHMIEPGVHVEKVMLAQHTPALKFIPTGSGPNPVALLAHGYSGSKETLFRYGEALAATVLTKSITAATITRVSWPAVQP